MKTQLIFHLLICLVFTLSLRAEETQAKLQIINASKEKVSILWLKSSTEEIPNKDIAPGSHAVIDTP